MLGLFAAIKDRFKTKFDSISIDNWIFQLHYYVTTTVFLIATILVTSRQYIGEHIKCISDTEKKIRIETIEAFCFFNSTYTVIQNKTLNFEKYGILSYFGHAGEEAHHKIRYHRYYQWVPFVLFGQAIMFYLTHLLWKSLEGGRIKNLVNGLTYSSYALSSEKETQVGSKTIPSRKDVDKCIDNIKKVFFERIFIDRSWARWFIFCELLNTFHVVLEFYITDRFLGRQFAYLGTNVVEFGYKALDDVFPKAGRCQFHKYGPSGSIEMRDALCILPLNIINEKIYMFLWFWFVIVFVASCLALIWRFCTVLLYKNSVLFNQIVFGVSSRRKLYHWHCKMISKSLSYEDWLLLKYLSKNIDGRTFKELFITMSEDLEETKPLCIVSGGRKLK